MTKKNPSRGFLEGFVGVGVGLSIFSGLVNPLKREIR